MIRLLIVEDEPFGDEVRDYVKRNGWEAETAKNVKRAKEILSERGQEFDAIVLDKMLEEDQDGTEILKWARTQLSLVNICVVMVTGRGGLPNAIEAFKLGAFHYLQKPDVSLHELQDVLRAGIALHRAHRMRSELLKTLDGARIIAQVINLIHEVMGSELIHPIFFELDGTLSRVQGNGERVKERHRAFISRLADASSAQIAAVFEDEFAKVAELDPIVSGSGSLIAVPVMGSRGEMRGVLELESGKQHAFSQSWLDVLRYLADLIGIGLEIGKEVELLTQVYREFRHSIATNVQIVATQAHRLQQLDLSAPEEPADSIRDRVRFIADNASIVEETVQDIKAIVAAPPKPRIEKVDVRKLAKDCLGEQAPKLEELRIGGLVESNGQPVSAETDQESLAYSLRCLLNNAVESIQDNRRQQVYEQNGHQDQIVVEVKDTGSSVRIEVRDSGIGFNGETEAKLFLPLFSTKAKTLSNGKTAELTGLNRVERLLELMGRWCRHDPRSKALPAELGSGFELLIRDGESIDLFIGHRPGAPLDVANLRGSGICHVGTDSPLAAEWLGRGEGLFSVQKYMARVGGAVSASSQGIGKGATFTITLPKSA